MSNPVKDNRQDRVQARKQWNRTPCGSTDTQAEVGTLEFFDQAAYSRYQKTDTWMNEAVDWNYACGRQLLEIGHGIGTDLVRFSQHGAVVHGVDITETHHQLCKKNLSLHGIKGEIKLCDADALAYPDNRFDVVYSHGVLHHIANTEDCIKEIYRVLKPGGILMLGLYHRWHLMGIIYVLYGGIWKSKLWKLGWRGFLSRIERGADGKDIRPLVKLYSRRQVKLLLRDFKGIRCIVQHLECNTLTMRYPLLFHPRFVSWLSRWMGHYVFAYACKPTET